MPPPAIIAKARAPAVRTFHFFPYHAYAVFLPKGTQGTQGKPRFTRVSRPWAPKRRRIFHLGAQGAEPRAGSPLIIGEQATRLQIQFGVTIS
jgi:hypothetical protein